MKKTKYIFLNLIVLFFLIFPIAISSQTKSNLELIIKYNPPIEVKLEKAETTMKLFLISKPGDLFALNIDFYQKFISPQDVPSCIFTPSCSHFSEHAIHKFGLLKGILLTSDRLQRCHVLSNRSKWYSFNFMVNRFNDPVHNYGINSEK